MTVPEISCDCLLIGALFSTFGIFSQTVKNYQVKIILVVVTTTLHWIIKPVGSTLNAVKTQNGFVLIFNKVY